MDLYGPNSREFGYVALLAGEISHAMRPFNPGPIALRVEDRGVNKFVVVVAEIENLPGDWRVSIPVQFALSSESGIIEYVARTLHDQIRNRPSAPVDDHIILGTE